MGFSRESSSKREITSGTPSQRIETLILLTTQASGCPTQYEAPWKELVAEKELEEKDEGATVCRTHWLGGTRLRVE